VIVFVIRRAVRALSHHRIDVIPTHRTAHDPADRVCISCVVPHPIRDPEND